MKIAVIGTGISASTTASSGFGASILRPASPDFAPAAPTSCKGSCNMCKFAPKISDYSGTEPIMEFEKFFDGMVKAWGIVQDRSGKVLKRFDIDMMTTWQGANGTMREDFTYYGDKKETRIWNITKTGDKTYTGRSDDIVGEATGEAAGCAIGFRYVLKVPVDGKIINISFDDRMYMMNGGVVINRAVMRKFGFRVGDVTVFMQKQ